MLGVCPDAVFESIEIIATQWALCYPYINKSTNPKNSFDDFNYKIIDFKWLVIKELSTITYSKLIL